MNYHASPIMFVLYPDPKMYFIFDSLASQVLNGNYCNSNIYFAIIGMSPCWIFFKRETLSAEV